MNEVYKITLSYPESLLLKRHATYSQAVISNTSYLTPYARIAGGYNGQRITSSPLSFYLINPGFHVLLPSGSVSLVSNLRSELRRPLS